LRSEDHHTIKTLGAILAVLLAIAIVAAFVLTVLS
jgi:hypothetical protein